MPSCRPDIIPSVLYKVMDLRPEVILDVGAGHGKWGVLCYEYLKYWCNIEPVVDGVEIFKDYASKVYGVYRQVFHNDIVEVLDIVKNYDLVLIVDVIEHLEKEAGLKLLGTVSKHYLVSTPAYWNAQGASFGNDHEKHLSRWSTADFKHSQLIKDRLGREHIMGWK